MGSLGRRESSRPPSSPPSSPAPPLPSSPSSPIVSPSLPPNGASQAPSTLCSPVYLAGSPELSVNPLAPGMVAACAGCDAFRPWAALLVGLGAGVAYMCVSWLVTRVGLDDPVDAVAVHAGGGLWGCLAAPLLRDGGVVGSLGCLNSATPAPLSFADLGHWKP